MSHKAYIAICFIVNICVLAHTFVPHHHHGNSIAFLVGEFTELDQEGYEHHHDDGTSHHAHSEDEILVWAAEQQELGNPVSIHPLPLFDWAAVYLEPFHIEGFSIVFDCSHHANIDLNIPTPYIYILGLRAPPVC